MNKYSLEFFISENKPYSLENRVKGSVKINHFHENKVFLWEGQFFLVCIFFKAYIIICV